ncbi:MAG: twitching motility protein PilT [Sporichthyaceae bacterium]
MSDVVYDAGALFAAERNDREFWADHRVRLEDGVVPVIPAPVVAQVSRSPRQAQLRRLLRGCEVPSFDEAAAHRVGTVLARGTSADIADGAVVEAASGEAVIVTSDRPDISRLLNAVGSSATIRDI